MTRSLLFVKRRSPSLILIFYDEIKNIVFLRKAIKLLS